MLKIFTIFDSKANIYERPFYARATGEALRIFINLVNDPKSQIHQFPDDFTLFELGEFNERTGLLVLKSTMLDLGKATVFVEPVNV